MKRLESVILIPIPDAENAVKSLREKYDPVALRGIPAHITVLFPFYSPDVITNNMISRLTDLFNNVAPFEFTLSSIGAFPNVVFLDPDPPEPFIALTKKVFSQFPDKPPYEGKYPEINPHLTIAQLSEGQNFDMIKSEIINRVAKMLPIATEAKEALLMIEDKNENWTTRASFSFNSQLTKI